MPKKEHKRADLYLAARESGLTYQQIADKYGVSRQAVADVCGKYNPKYFQIIKEDDCIFPNLRKWMNDHKVSRKELTRRIGLVTYAYNVEVLTTYLKGVVNPRKDVIDKMLKVTGMTYEEMFYTEER